MAIIGDAISVGTDLIGKALWGATKGIGKTAVSAGSAMLGAGWNASVSAVKMAGKGAIKGAEFTGKAAYQSLNNERSIFNPVGHAANLMKKAGEAVTKGPLAMGRMEYESRHVNVFTGKTEINSGGLKLTGVGATALFGSAAVAGSQDMERQYRSNRVGPVDPQTRTATPSFQKQEYVRGVDDGGATGDLIFALHNNRRG